MAIKALFIGITHSISSLSDCYAVKALTNATNNQQPRELRLAIKYVGQNTKVYFDARIAQRVSLRVGIACSPLAPRFAELCIIGNRVQKHTKVSGPTCLKRSTLWIL